MTNINNDLKNLNLKTIYDNEQKNLVEVLQKDEVLESSTNTKKKNVEFSQFINNIEGIMADTVKERISSCGDFLQFLADEEIEHLKLENANFCGNRFCPQCSANKAREDAIELATLVEYVKQELGYSFIFLTLTAPNIGAEEVEQELHEYYEAFKKMFKNKKVKAVSKGYIRKLEMTYNAERGDFHPHYHVLIAVNRSYFTDKRYYISQNEWLNLWRRAKEDPTIEVVDVRKFKAQDDLYKAIFEISKYISKDSDYMYNPDVFKVFYKALKNKRMLSFSGCFKEAVKLYKAGDLIDYMGDDPNEHIRYVKRLWYQWNDESYKESQTVDLTPEEIEKANLTRREKAEIKKQQEQEIAELNAQDIADRKEYITNARSSRSKTKDLETGEMELLPAEKRAILLKLKQREFDKRIEDFNRRHHEEK